MLRFLLLIIGISSLLIITSCFGPIRDSENYNYEITTYAKNLNCKLSANLFVMPMRANSPFDNNAIYFSNEENQLASYSFNHWVSVPSAMLTTNLALSLANSCTQANILVEGGLMANAKYRISSRLLNLRLNVINSKAPVAEMSIYVELFDLTNNQLVSGQLFQLSKPTVAKPSNFVATVNQLNLEFNQQLITWLNSKQIS